MPSDALSILWAHFTLHWVKYQCIHTCRCPLFIVVCFETVALQKRPFMNYWSLLTSRHFLPQFLTQFLGACNDNIFKNAVIILIVFQLADASGGNAPLLVALATGLFILPFFLCSLTAGQIADKYRKSTLILQINPNNEFCWLNAHIFQRNRLFFCRKRSWWTLIYQIFHCKDEMIWICTS